MNWDEEVKPNWINQKLLISRKRFLLTNIIYGVIGFLSYYIFLG